MCLSLLRDGGVLPIGLLAAVVLSTITHACRALRWTRLSLPLLLGTLFTPRRRLARGLGTALYVLGSWLFALLYVWLFEAVGLVSWWFGGAVGTMHGLFLLVVVLPLLPGLHPRMADDIRGPATGQQLEPPGFLACNYGRLTPRVVVAAHAAYGALIALLYQLATRA